MATQVKLPPPRMNEGPDAVDEAAVMGFFDHLEELRNRLFRAILAVAIGMAISVVFTPAVLELIKSTYGDYLQVLSPTESIVVFFRVVLLCGAILASPVITYQLLMFVI